MRAFLYTVDSLLTDTFATDTQCPSQEDVCLKESQLERSKERQGPTLVCVFAERPSYRGQWWIQIFR